MIGIVNKSWIKRPWIEIAITMSKTTRPVMKFHWKLLTHGNLEPELIINLKKNLKICEPHRFVKRFDRSMKWSKRIRQLFLKLQQLLLTGFYTHPFNPPLATLFSLQNHTALRKVELIPRLTVNNYLQLFRECVTFSIPRRVRKTHNNETTINHFGALRARSGESGQRLKRVEVFMTARRAR